MVQPIRLHTLEEFALISRLTPKTIKQMRYLIKAGKMPSNRLPPAVSTFRGLILWRSDVVQSWLEGIPLEYPLPSQEPVTLAMPRKRGRPRKTEAPRIRA